MSKYYSNKNICSVIVPLFHGKKYIPELILQMEACARIAPNIKIELVISNDAPEEVLEENGSSNIITIKELNTDINRGIHGARVRGFVYSSGDYIVFLDQDDKISPEYFSGQLRAIGTADAVVCNASSDGRMKYNADRPLCKAACRESMVKEGNMILSPGQVLIRREAVPGSWIKNVMQRNGADDWLLWLCMHSESRQFVINEEVLFFRQMHYANASFDSQKMTASEEEVERIIEQERLLCAEERKCLRELLPKLQKKRIKENEKFKKMFFIQNDWLRAYNREKSVGAYLKSREIETAAVYGYGYLGKVLIEDLKKSGIAVLYVIDRNADYLCTDLKCCTLEELPEQADTVIVTLISDDRSEILAQISKRLKTEILWLEDIIFDIARNK